MTIKQIVRLNRFISILALVLFACNAVLVDASVADDFVVLDLKKELSMCGDCINEDDFGKIEISIAEVVGDSNSLDELELWLQSQQCIGSVILEDYIIKTFPPRREFTIGIKMEGGTIRERILTIVLLRDDKFEFHEMREPS